MTLNEVRPDVIFHVAAAHASSSDMINFQKRHAAEIFDTSLEITKNILEWQKRNKQTRSVVALSSHMYSGINGEHLVDVDCIPSPISDYGRAKAETFSYIKRMRSLYDLRVSAAILFNHTSVHGRSDFIYPILASQICDVLLGKETEIRIRNFSSRIDISDAEEICEAMFKMSELTSSKDFVLGSGQAPSLEIITLEALKFFGVGFDVSLISTERISHSSSVLVSDIRHAKNFLDWTPMNDPISLLIRLVIEHLRSRQV
jgi:GDP-D-mannose dehydratase